MNIPFNFSSEDICILDIAFLNKTNDTTESAKEVNIKSILIIKRNNLQRLQNIVPIIFSFYLATKIAFWEDIVSQETTQILLKVVQEYLNEIQYFIHKMSSDCVPPEY